MHVFLQIALPILGLVLPLSADAGDYTGDFQRLKKSVPPEKMEQHLAEWRKREPTNPDAFILSANWFFEQASSGLNISAKSAAPGDLVIADPKSRQAVGSIAMAQSFDPVKTNQAADFLRQALQRWPQRFDLHCGLAHMMQESKQWEPELAALRAAASAVKEYGTNLRWCHGEAIPPPVASFVVLKFHSFALHQYEQETPATDAHFGEIARLMVEAAPGQAESYNDLAISFGLTKDYAHMQEALEQGVKIAPKDWLVWLNLGDNSLRLGLIPRARECFGAVLKGKADEASKEAARKALQNLK